MCIRDRNIPNQEFIEAITLNNLAKVSEGKPIGSNNMERALLGYALELSLIHI